MHTDFSALATFFSGLSFLFFGVSLLFSPYMKREFIRYGYAGQRVLTGWLQILGGTGLIVGFWLSPLLCTAAAAGLSLMMMFGFAVRMKIRDTLFQATPAFFYAALNLYLTLYYAGLIEGSAVN